MVIKKRKAGWIAVILSVMMVFAFMPFLGTQEAYAIPIKDTLTIDMSNGAWTTDDVEQSNAIKEFIWDAANAEVIAFSATAVETRETYYLDFDWDRANDVIVELNKESGKMTIKRTDHPSLEEANLQQSAERLAYYEEMSDFGYDPDALSYYYRGIHFIIADLVDIKDDKVDRKSVV